MALTGGALMAFTWSMMRTRANTRKRIRCAGGFRVTKATALGKGASTFCILDSSTGESLEGEMITSCRGFPSLHN